MSFSSFVPERGSNNLFTPRSFKSFSCLAELDNPVLSISYKRMICLNRNDNLRIMLLGMVAVSLLKHIACNPLADKESTSFSPPDRKSTRLNSSHVRISYAVFCLKKKKKTIKQ